MVCHMRRELGELGKVMRSSRKEEEAGRRGRRGWAVGPESTCANHRAMVPTDIKRESTVGEEVHVSYEGKNFKMCTNAYFFEKKSELSELHYIFNLLESKTL